MRYILDKEDLSKYAMYFLFDIKKSDISDEKFVELFLTLTTFLSFIEKEEEKNE